MHKLIPISLGFLTFFGLISHVSTEIFAAGDELGSPPFPKCVIPSTSYESNKGKAVIVWDESLGPNDWSVFPAKGCPKDQAWDNARYYIDKGYCLGTIFGIPRDGGYWMFLIDHAFSRATSAMCK